MTTPTPYGLCPVCGQPGFARERRPNGNDTCPNGHTYPSRDAVADKSMTTPTPRTIAQQLRDLDARYIPTGAMGQIVHEQGIILDAADRIEELESRLAQADHLIGAMENSRDQLLAELKRLTEERDWIMESRNDWREKAWQVAEKLNREVKRSESAERDLAAREAELAAMKQGKVLADGMANMIRGFILKTVERETLDEAAAKYRKWEEDYCHSTPAKLDRAIAAEQRAEAAERARDSYCEKFNRQCEEADEQTRQRMAAERKAEEAARDSARLDWMIEHGTDEGGGSGFEFRVYIPHDSECLRDAIDADIAAKGGA